MKKSLLIAASLILLLGLAACDVSLAGDVTPPPGSGVSAAQPTDAPAEISMPSGIDLEAGAAIYAEKCSDCHGPQGLGDGSMGAALGVQIPPIGVLEQAVLVSPQEWFTVIRDGRMDLMMPPFSGSLSDEQIWDVLGYVYALETDPDLLAEGEQIYAEVCAVCHGDDGQGGASAGAPSHQDPERMTTLSVAEIVDKIATGNGNEAHAFASQLDSDQQTAATLYVRSLLFGSFDVSEAVEAPVAEEPTATPEANGEEAAAEETGETAPTDEAGDSTTEEAQPTTESEAVEEPAVEGSVITGHVINGSGGDIPEGLEVSLQGYVQFELSIDLTAPVEADGSFRFEGVTMNADDIFIAVVEYEDMFYPSDFYVAGGGDQDVDFEVVIYDTTTDKSGLSVMRVHVFFEWLSTDLVQVVHLVSISNSGSETVYTPGETDPVLEFSLPPDALNLVFETGVIGDPYVATANGFGDPRPVAPGEGSYEILFAYEMEYDGSLEWTLPIDLPTDFLAVFVEGQDVKLQSAEMASDAPQTLDDAVYQTMVASGLTAGDTITLDISGKVKLDSGSSTLLEDSNTFVIVAGVLGLALAGYGVWNFLGKNSGEETGQDELDADSLVDEIAALDDAFEAGGIDEREYKEQRTALKALLRELMDKE